MSNKNTFPLFHSTVITSAILLIYIFTARLGLMLDSTNAFATFIWAPTGISLAALLIFGFRFWPTISIAALIVNYTNGVNLISSVGISFGNTLEAVSGAYMLYKFINFDKSLSRIKDVVGLIALPGLISTMLCAVIGTISLWLGGEISIESFKSTFQAWWVGDFLGVLVVAPLLLIWSTKPLIKNTPEKIAELFLMVALLLLLNIFLFTGLRLPESMDFFPQVRFGIFPFIVWSALRFGQRGTITTVFFVSILAVWGTINGYGPFSVGLLKQRFLYLDGFMAVSAITGMILASSISERLVRELSIRRSEEIKTSVLRSSLDAIIAIDHEAKICEFSPAAEATFGYQRDDVMGKPLVDFIIPQKFRQNFRNEFSSGFTSNRWSILNKRVEIECQNKNLQIIPIEIVITSIKNNGTFMYYFILRDISGQKNTTEEILAAKQAAEAASIAKSAFLANMSHEIRTPLGAVMGYSDLVIDPDVSLNEKINYVAAIKRNGELLSNIINDILDLSKVEAGKMEVHFQDAAIHEILTDAKTPLELQAHEKGLELTFEVNESVPTLIKTDAMRLRQILINIIGNAIKFTAKGSIHVAIHSDVMGNGHHQIIFSVQDTGSGINHDQIDKLFSPFSQVDTTSTRRFGGTGLGLVISKRIANLLGGDVVLSRSEIGKGSLFTISVHSDPIQKRTDLKRAPQFTKSGQAISLDGIKILLVDDAVDNQILISRMLMLAGAKVDLASNGLEALEKATTSQYNVLLMDIQMPVMNGYEATAELRKLGYSGKIIALTAHALSDEREKCLSNGFNDHIGKPINRKSLIERVYYHS